MRVSVIVPVYNVEKYLRDCLDSLLDQGMETSDYEIICINDGSNDNSLQILKEYAAKHINIIVIDKENSGVALARNAGLDIAKGEYIAFCDSDDAYRNDALTKSIAFMEENNIDVSLFMSHKNVEEEYSYKRGESYQISAKVMPNANLSVGAVWRMIVRKQLIDSENIRFVEGMKYGEDTLFCARIYVAGMENSVRLASISTPVYYYRNRQGSAMHQSAPEIHFNDMHIMALEYKKAMNTTTNKEVLKNLRMRIDSLVTTLLYDNLKARKYEPKKICELLKQEGLYPCSIPFWTMRNRSLKINLLALFKCLLLFKPIHYLSYKIFNK